MSTTPAHVCSLLVSSCKCSEGDLSDLWESVVSRWLNWYEPFPYPLRVILQKTLRKLCHGGGLPGAILSTGFCLSRDLNNYTFIHAQEPRQHSSLYAVNLNYINMCIWAHVGKGKQYYPPKCVTFPCDAALAKVWLLVYGQSCTVKHNPSVWWSITWNRCWDKDMLVKWVFEWFVWSLGFGAFQMMSTQPSGLPDLCFPNWITRTCSGTPIPHTARLMFCPWIGWSEIIKHHVKYISLL